MATPKDSTPKEVADGGLTKVKAASLVKRKVPVLENGKPTGDFKDVAIGEKDVLDFAVRADGTVVVVTTDGQKLFGSV